MNLSSSVAKILKGDYRLDGTVQIIVVTVDGSVKGYSFNYEMRGIIDDSSKPVSSNNQSETLYNDLLKKKNVFFSIYVENLGSYDANQFNE